MKLADSWKKAPKILTDIVAEKWPKTTLFVPLLFHHSTFFFEKIVPVVLPCFHVLE